MTISCFAKYEPKAYPIKYAGTAVISTIAGGTPTDPNVAEAWLRSKTADKDELIREAVATIMVERGVTVDEATDIVNKNKHLNGFKRDKGRDNELYIEGRQLKAAIKEAASVAAAAGKLSLRGWGKTNKGLLGWISEHVFVIEERLHLGVTKPTGVAQRFISTRFGSGIQYEEYVEDVKIAFTVETDHEFTEEQWAMLWLTGGRQGLGASRSQGFGRYEIVSWDRRP